MSLEAGRTYDGKIAGLYDLEETLGSGHFAVVKLARHVFTGAKVAVKVVDKTKLDEVSKAHLFQEVRCMKLVQHPNVVRLYEVIDTQTKLYLVLEFGDGGDLYDYIMKHDAGLTEQLARKYFRQILHAITYCHQLHVVHRDLKPENVVFFEKLGIVKLTDFGFSNKFSPGQKLDTFCGSLAYSAPEILLGDSYDAPAVDIWSLGVILYMLVCGQPPFEKGNDSETLTMIMDCKYTVPANVSDSCRKLIASMLVRDPKKRATLSEIAKDDWLKNAEDEPPISEHHLPLVSREQLSEEDHAFIIQKMTNGNIAPKEEILQALDKNKYNHITATYFLLAELRLRKRREELEPKKKQLGENSRSRIDKLKGTDTAKILVPISINISPAENITNEAKTEKRPRKCSIVCEEDEEDSAGENSNIGNDLKVAIVRRESISDNRLNLSVQERAITPIAQQARPKVVVQVDATLAQKLNRIDKEHLTETTKNMEKNIIGLKDMEISKLKILPVTNKNPVLTHRRSKMNKIRTPSCSSSEASDDDTKTRNKKKMNKFVGDAPVRWRMHRRDSHDDSSDSQDQLYPSTASHANTAAYVRNHSANIGGKNDGQSKESNKTGDTGKSHTQKTRKEDWQEGGNHIHSERRSLPSLAVSGLRRRRIRESQSLDRITEAQEYDLRHRSCYVIESSHIEQRNSLFNLSTISLAETMEEYDEETETIPEILTPSFDFDQNKGTSNVFKAANQFRTNLNLSSLRKFSNRKTPKDIYKLNSIEEIDMIIEEKTFTKAIQLTGTKCLVTMKKLRRLGKLFPVVNLS